MEPPSSTTGVGCSTGAGRLRLGGRLRHRRGSRDRLRLRGLLLGRAGRRLIRSRRRGAASVAASAAGASADSRRRGGDRDALALRHLVHLDGAGGDDRDGGQAGDRLRATAPRPADSALPAAAPPAAAAPVAAAPPIAAVLPTAAVVPPRPPRFRWRLRQCRRPSSSRIRRRRRRLRPHCAARGDAAARGARAELRDDELLDDHEQADRVDGRERAVCLAQLGRGRGGSARSASGGGGPGRSSCARPSATWPSSSRTSSQVRSRASAASASDTRARTRSDFTLGTVVSIASAIWSYESASISRSSSAVRWVSGRSCTSATIWRNSSRRWTVSAVVTPPSRSKTSIESRPVGDRAAQVVQAAVARDPVEPRARVDRPVVGEHRVERGGEDLLQHVLGVLGRAEHVAAEGEQPRLVALEERVEGAVVAAPDERDQLLVALEPEQGRPPGERGPGAVDLEHALPQGDGPFQA